MTATVNADRDPERLSAALKLVARRYARQIRRRPALSIAALLLPGIGNMLVFFTPPLVVAKLLDRFDGGNRLSAAELTPYVLAFAGLWFAGEDRLANRRRATGSRRGARPRSAVHRSDGRAAGERPRVLSRQLRRLAHQARAWVRSPVRGRLRRHLVPGAGECGAAGIRHGRAVELFAAAHRGVCWACCR